MHNAEIAVGSSEPQWPQNRIGFQSPKTRSRLLSSATPIISVRVTESNERKNIRHYDTSPHVRQAETSDKCSIFFFSKVSKTLVAGVRAASVYSATVCAWVDMTAGSTRADANQKRREEWDGGRCISGKHKRTVG